MMTHPQTKTEGVSSKSTVDADGIQKRCRFAKAKNRYKGNGKVHTEDIKITKGKIEKGNFGKC